MSLFGRLLFPPRCAACRELLDWKREDGALCDSCRREWLSETLECCGICAMRVGDCKCMPTELEKARCDGFLKLVYYVPRRNEAVQNRLIFRIKERISRRATDFLASELLPAIQAVLSERGVTPNDAVFTYLPRARRARLAHGTDQARELARALAKRSEIPCLPLILRHARANKRQKMLSPTKRLENAKASYFPNGRCSCKGKTVLLVDDLVTTGAGMAVATRILRRMGAVSVIGVAVGSDAVNKDPERR